MKKIDEIINYLENGYKVKIQMRDLLYKKGKINGITWDVVIFKGKYKENNYRVELDKIIKEYNGLILGNRFFKYLEVDNFGLGGSIYKKASIFDIIGDKVRRYLLESEFEKVFKTK